MKPSNLEIKDVGFDMRRPCGDCPFKKGTPAHEGIAGFLVQYFKDIENNRFAHTCHKTDVRPQCDGPVRGRSDLTIKPQHCAGAIVMLAKTRKGADLQIALLRALESGALPLDEYERMIKDLRPKIHTMRSLLKFYGEWAIKKVRERASRRQARRLSAQRISSAENQTSEK